MLKTLQRALKKYTQLNLPLKASLWFTICSIIQKGISIIAMPIFTRLMSTEQYGEYNVFLTWYNIFLLVVTLNIHTEIFNKGLIEHDSEKDAYTLNQAGLIAVLTAVFLLLCISFRDLINQFLGLSTPLTVILALEIMGSSIVALWTARKRFDYKYKSIVALTLGMAIVTQGLGIVVVRSAEDKAFAKILTNAIVPIVVAAFVLISVAKKSKSRGHWKWWKTVIAAALPLLPHYLSLVLLNQSDKLLINHFIGAEKAAIYSIAHTAGLLMTIINNSINGAFVPWAYGKIKYENGDGIKSVSKALFVMVMVVNAFLIWGAPEAIQLLAPPQYSEAVYCLVPIAASVYFYFVYTLFVDVEIYFGANHYIAVASVIAALLNLVLNYFLIPKFGYLVAGYVTLLSYFATMVVHYFFLCKTMKKQSIKVSQLFDLKSVGLNGFVLIAISVIAILLYPYPLVRYLILIVGGIGIYLKRKTIIDVVKRMGVIKI